MNEPRHLVDREYLSLQKKESNKEHFQRLFFEGQAGIETHRQESPPFIGLFTTYLDIKRLSAHIQQLINIDKKKMLKDITSSNSLKLLSNNLQILACRECNNGFKVFATTTLTLSRPIVQRLIWPIILYFAISVKMAGFVYQRNCKEHLRHPDQGYPVVGIDLILFGVE